MNPEKLLDAIGMLDDRHFEPETKTQIINYRRRFVVLIAAVLATFLLAGTALAVSSDLRDAFFSIFHIAIPERPPIEGADPLPNEDGVLHKITTVNIDEVVSAHYFTADGYVRTYDGGFYTSSRRNDDAAPTDGRFWEIRADDIIPVDTTRVDFPLTYGDLSFRIIFDYAILNQKLCIKIWPLDLNGDPIANGWNAEALGNRTDIVLLTMPVDLEKDYTHDFLLLDLKTLEITNLLEDIPHDDIIIDAGWFTEDLHYAIINGIEKEYSPEGYCIGGYWFCDLEENTMVSFYSLTGISAPQNIYTTEPYFLDDRTIIYKDVLPDGNINVISYHIPTGVQTTIIQNVADASSKNLIGYRGIQRHWGNGVHGLLHREDGSVDLIDLRTQSTLNMPGLKINKLTTSESPDGSRILIAYTEKAENVEWGYGFSSLGILNPETGVLLMLSRNTTGNSEYFLGWLDNDTIVITSTDPNGNYYVYVYQCHEPCA